MIINQYPHFLYEYVTAPATQNDLGDWVPGVSIMAARGSCREETAGRGGIGKGINHSQNDFKDIVNLSTIYCPASCPHIAEGSTVIVSNEPLPPETTIDQAKTYKTTGKVRAFGTCKKFDRTAFHCRLWI